MRNGSHKYGYLSKAAKVWLQSMAGKVWLQKYGCKVWLQPSFIDQSQNRAKCGKTNQNQVTRENATNQKRQLQVWLLKLGWNSIAKVWLE
jgi:hypothetical protein